MIDTINGVDLHYEVMGNGPAIFAVHGGPGLGNNRGYMKWLQPLTDAFNVVAYDLRGCGQSGDAPNGSYSHADFVADLDALRRHLGFDKIALLGTSYGGFISLEYALAHQDHLTHLLLQDTAPSNENEIAARDNALKSGLPGIDHDMLDRLFTGRMASDEEFRQAFEAILPLYRAERNEQAEQQRADDITYRYQTHNFAFSKNVPQYDLRNRLSEIHVPTLVMVGEHDWITPPDQAEYLAAHIPGAKLVKFANSGHGPMMEENDKFIQVVRDFLSA